jgi:NAD(P)H-dependent flavin oxidoreductase YrpB (nitropropane dioxygenase family)
MRPSCYIILYCIMRAGDCKLGVAGKIMTTEEAQACLDAGMDFVLIGRLFMYCSTCSTVQRRCG